MKAFIKETGKVMPMDRPNVDTDAILPKQYLKSIQRTGFGPCLFDDWRYLDHGEPGQDHSQRQLNPDFLMNRPRYQQFKILLARDNFGCGSSREHAVWAFVDYGVRAIIAPSFADIFFNNSFGNGLLLITLDDDVVDSLFAEEAAHANAHESAHPEQGFELSIDLEAKTIGTPSGRVIEFDLDEFRRYRLLNGLDDIGLTLMHADDIRAFEQQRRQDAPWLFDEHMANN